jgi:hypothetical protein
LLAHSVAMWECLHTSISLKDIILSMNYEITPAGRARFGHKVLSGVPVPRETTETIAEPDVDAEGILSRRLGFLKPVRDLVERAMREPEEIQMSNDSAK